ncbi:hypothetical protein Patl1_24202 [Pistacia atlantica]|uniref:Uncharacterized protein n=1 Tax=Pistacia atlantica TaxID=434234 RepID=A0ACC0ZYE4_9ROSI|nr:hypothetical protein Patl1_24202 [Pistacia atlantica]
MIMLMKSSASVLAIVCLYVSCIFLHLLVLDVAQTQAQATTAPREEPCSGAAIDDSIALATDGYNPFIKCDCSYNKNTLCHIIGMSVYTVEVDGVIPDELWSLNVLIELDFSVNRFSGQLPKELGMLSELEFLNIGRNNFSGPLPSELGNLTKLKDLAIGTNNFSGPLPSELGKLTKLKDIIYGQCWWGLLTIEFTGRIPDFIGNWPNMEELRFQGNSFQGPIPSSFSKLTNLTDLFLGNNKVKWYPPCREKSKTSQYNVIGAMCSNLVANNFNLESSNSSRDELSPMQFSLQSRFWNLKILLKRLLHNKCSGWSPWKSSSKRISGSGI